MYYTGTEIECENYNTLVCQGENYQDTTSRWASVIKHYNQELYAIKINENYTSSLQTLKSLDGWQNVLLEEGIELEEEGSHGFAGVNYQNLKV